ncbi:RNA 3'-terminal phosphate cyclase-like [Oscarella lobularis]|uniref:RNA 3'-terminal phosphate cyclase-like n=1 Tax=Oscarella lobularis TaxID=121494 RepID=UPI00331328D0
MNSSCSKTALESSSECENSEANEHDVDVTLSSGRIEEMEKHPIVIDARNAGGQVLRIANALSFLTKKPITAQNIRQHRGLRESHTHQVDMVVTMSNGKAEGNEEGSIEYTLWPREAKMIANEKISLESKCEFIPTLQAVLPCFVFGKETSTLRWLGDMSMSRNADAIYFCQSVLRFVLRKFGVHFDIVTTTDDEGAEKTIVTVDSTKELKGVTMMTSCDRNIREIRATIFWEDSESKKKDCVNVREFEKHCIQTLKEEFGTDILIHCKTKYSVRHDETLSSLQLEVVTSDECILPEYAIWYSWCSSDREAKRIVSKAVLRCKRAYDNGVCVQGLLTDQILLFMALAKGTSTIRSDYPLPDDHWEKAISVIEELLDVKFSVRIDSEKEFVDISCEGIGMQNENFFDYIAESVFSM